jgi:hypothetical protein
MLDICFGCPDDYNCESAPLPKILMVDLRNRNVQATETVLNAPQDVPLVLERARPSDMKLK